jgi:hypothetical protein
MALRARGSDDRSVRHRDPDLLPLDEVVARSDILILCTPHMALQKRRSQGQAGGRRLGNAGERPDFADTHHVDGRRIHQ